MAASATATLSRDPLLIACLLVGSGKFGTIRLDATDIVVDLAKAIEAKFQELIPCTAMDLHLFVATDASGAFLPLTDDDIPRCCSGSIPEKFCDVLKSSGCRMFLQRPLAPYGFPRGRDYDHVHVLVVLPKPVWKPEEEPVYALDAKTLFFVNRERAVEQLMEVHEAVYFGATIGIRDGKWPIPLIDNELGLGKTAFSLEYIRRCRDMARVNPSKLGGKYADELAQCRTIRVVIGPGMFVRAAIDLTPCDRYTALECTMNKALAAAVVKELEPGCVPRYLQDPTSLSPSALVDAIVRDLGPIFIVLDEVGSGFENPTESGPDSDKRACELFIEFSSLVLQAWMDTKKVYFLLVGYAPHLRNVRQVLRKQQAYGSTTMFMYERIGLQVIQPDKIQEILRNTSVNSRADPTETLQDRWSLQTEQDVQEAATLVYEKTCGHPRSMFRLLQRCSTYGEFVEASVDEFNDVDGEHDWMSAYRKLRTWRKELNKLLPLIGTEKVVDLTESVKGIPESTFSVVMDSCYLRWHGTVEQAQIYALPRIYKAIASMVLPLNEYVTHVTQTCSRFSLGYPTCFAWACLKRFQALFSQPAIPHDVLPHFFGKETAFNAFALHGTKARQLRDGVRFAEADTVLPSITRATTRGHDGSLGSSTASIADWPALMQEMSELLLTDEVLTLKPLLPSSSVDVILMDRMAINARSTEASNQKTKNNKKKQRLESMVKTLTVGLAVKNDATTKFGKEDLDDECAKFNRMFDNLGDQTKKNLGTMTSVLIVCATNYVDDYATLFGGQGFVRLTSLSEFGNIDEVLLLDLTKRGRAAFFGFLDAPELATALDELIANDEHEKTSEEAHEWRLAV